jgi:hypothetical protein
VIDELIAADQAEYAALPPPVFTQHTNVVKSGGYQLQGGGLSSASYTSAANLITTNQ